MEACLRLYKKSRVSFVERVLVGFEEEMFSHCVGTIPELFDGNPPYHARGAISFAMNVAADSPCSEIKSKNTIYKDRRN